MINLSQQNCIIIQAHVAPERVGNIGRDDDDSDGDGDEDDDDDDDDDEYSEFFTNSALRRCAKASMSL